MDAAKHANVDCHGLDEVTAGTNEGRGGIPFLCNRYSLTMQPFLKVSSRVPVASCVHASPIPPDPLNRSTFEPQKYPVTPKLEGVTVQTEYDEIVTLSSALDPPATPLHSHSIGQIASGSAPY